MLYIVRLFYQLNGEWVNRHVFELFYKGKQLFGLLLSFPGNLCKLVLTSKGKNLLSFGSWFLPLGVEPRWERKINLKFMLSMNMNQYATCLMSCGQNILLDYMYQSINVSVSFLIYFVHQKVISENIFYLKRQDINSFYHKFSRVQITFYRLKFSLQSLF